MEIMVSFTPSLSPSFLKTYLLTHTPSQKEFTSVPSIPFSPPFSAFRFLICIFDAHLFYWHLLICKDLKSLSSLKLRNQKNPSFLSDSRYSYLHQKRIHVMFQHKDKLENTKSYFLLLSVSSKVSDNLIHTAVKSHWVIVWLTPFSFPFYLYYLLSLWPQDCLLKTISWLDFKSIK